MMISPNTPNVQISPHSVDKRDAQKTSNFPSSAQLLAPSQNISDSGISQQQKFEQVLSLMLPLLQQLLQQFSSENPSNPDNKPEVNPDPELTDPVIPSPPPEEDSFLEGKFKIKGTEGDDTINGTYEGDEIRGFSGNDQLYGRQGNDIIDGGQGDDHLYGGSGDDYLGGGVGNDYLSGGRGNNNLYGGAGNDVLASRLGSDILDGGEGNDTARIRGNIDDYSINKAQTFGYDIVLTNEKTGDTIHNINIENFKFNDATLSLDDMIQRAEATDTPSRYLDRTTLSSSQEDNLLKFIEGNPDDYLDLRIVDEDGDGKVSAGDTVNLSEQPSKTLSTDDAATINGENQLSLSRAERRNVIDSFSADRPDVSNIRVTDEDNSGTISAGDVINGVMRQDEDSRFFSSTIDANQAAEINGELGSILHSNEFSTEADNIAKNVADLLNVSSNSSSASERLEIFDTDGSSNVSEGDVLKVTDLSDFPSTSTYHTLSASDIQSINEAGIAAEPLTLTLGENIALHEHFDDLSPLAYDGEATEYADITLDQDGDGKLSVGDIVKLRHFDGNSPKPLEADTDHALTAEDIATINQSAGSPGSYKGFGQ